MCFGSSSFTPLIVPMTRKWHWSSSVRDTAKRTEESLKKTARKTFNPQESAKRDYERKAAEREEGRKKKVMEKRPQTGKEKSAVRF